MILMNWHQDGFLSRFPARESEYGRKLFGLGGIASVYRMGGRCCYHCNGHSHRTNYC